MEPFRKPVNVKALANLDDTTRIIFAVPTDSKIMSVRDIVNSETPLRVFMGSKVGGNAEMFARWTFACLGYSKKDLQNRGFTLYGGTPNECSSMMREGQLDVMSMTNPANTSPSPSLLRIWICVFFPSMNS